MENQIKVLLLMVLIIIACSESIFGQSVSVNSTGAAAHPNAILDVSTTGNQGVLLARMSTATRTAWSPTTSGVTVYDTDTESYWYWNDTINQWMEIPNTAGIVTTLDGAYDGGGSGVGRVITADAGAVDIQGNGGLLVNGITGIGTSSPDATYKMTVLNGAGPTVKVGGPNTGLGLLVEANAGAEDGISSIHSSTSNASAYYAIRGEVTNESGVGYLGYHTSGDNSYAVYGQSGTYAGYFDGNVNITGELQINGSAGTSGQVLVSQGSGFDPIWGAAGVQSVTAGAGLLNSGTAAAPILDVAADNGLNVDAGQDKVQLGGPLTEATTITLGANPLTINVNNGTAGNDFSIQDGGLDHFTIDNSGDATFGGDVYMNDGDNSGITLFRFFDGGSGDDGNFDIYRNGTVNHSLDGDGDVWFNQQAADRNFRVQSLNESNMLFLDAGLDRIGIATGSPSQMLDVNGTIRMRGGTTTSGFVPVSSGDGTMVWTDPTTLGIDATTASNGLTEVSNDIRLGGTLTQNTTVTQTGFTLDFTTTATDGFSIDGTTFSVDGANDRVGIGTAAPSAPLHVYSGSDDVVRVQGVDHARLYIDGTNNSEKALILSEAGTEQWQVGMDNVNPGGSTDDFIVKQTNNGASEFTIQASSGNVGIGATAPKATLNIQKNGGAGLLISSANANTAGNLLGEVLFDNATPGTDASAVIRALAADNMGGSNKGADLLFMTKKAQEDAVDNATERMRITDDGNIGIGTTTPYQKLHVAGEVRISGLAAGGNVQANTSGDLILSNDLPAGDSDYIQNQFAAQQSSSEYWISGRGRMDGGLTVGAGATIDNNDINAGTIANGALAFGNASGEGIGSKRTAGGNQFGLDFYTASTNRMVIQNLGNVGIGTTTPGARLAVADIGAPGYKNFMVGDDSYFTDIDVVDFVGLYGNTNTDQGGLRLGSDGSYIYGDGGNIGVGTTTPGAKLHVNGVGLIQNAFAIDNGNGNTGTVANSLTFGNASGEGIGSKRTAGGNQFGLDFYTASTNRMVIQNLGNVGIGTTTPGARLAVADIGAPGYKNFMVGDDSYFTDIDVTDFLGLYSNVNPDRAGLRLGSDGSYLFGDGGNIGIGTTSPTAALNVIHPTSNTTPTAPGGYWAALIENRYDANDGRNGLSVVTRWGATTSKVFEAASYWNGGAESYTPILTVFGNRTVGIGNSNPQAVLHVSGSGTTGTFAYGYLTSGGATGTCGSCTAAYTIQADGIIRATEFNAISDNRIKKIVGRTRTSELLDAVNKLKVTEYEYIDKVANGNLSKEGFIAQEVEEVLPSAIKISKDFIPNIYALPRSFSQNRKKNTLLVKLDGQHELGVGDEVKFVTESGEKTAFVCTANDEYSFTVKDWTDDVTQLFVYGKKVDDFRAVDYDQVLAISIGAIQELSKENDLLKSEVEMLKEQLNDLNGLKAEVDQIKASLNLDVLGASKE